MANSKESPSKSEGLSRNLWLAGLGVCGKNFNAIQETIQDKSQSFQEKSHTVFEELVARGEIVESNAKDKLENTQEKIKEATEKVAAKREELLSKSKDSLKLDDIESRVEELRKKIADNLKTPSFNADEQLSKLKSKAEGLKTELNDKFSSVAKA